MAHGCLLRWAVGCCEGAAPAVLVHRCAGQPGERLLVRLRVELKHQGDDSLAPHVAIRSRIQRLAAAIQREHASAVEHGRQMRGEDELDASWRGGGQLRGPCVSLHKQAYRQQAEANVPATALLHCAPACIASRAMWTPTSEEEQAVSTATAGPRNPCRYEMRPAATLSAEPEGEYEVE